MHSGIEFDTEMCAMRIMKNGKREKMEGIELPNQEKNQKARRKENLQMLRNIGSGQHQTSRDERNSFKK